MSGRRHRDKRYYDDSRSFNTESRRPSSGVGEYSQHRYSQQRQFYSGDIHSNNSRYNSGDRHDRDQRDRSPIRRSRRSESYSRYPYNSYNQCEERREHPRDNNPAQHSSSGIRRGCSSSQQNDQRPTNRSQNRDFLTLHAGGRHSPQETYVRRDPDTQDIVYRRLQEDKLCQYCGNDFLGEAESAENEGYHEQCISVHKPRCEEAASTFRDFSKGEHVLSMAISVQVLHGSKVKQGHKQNIKEKRDKKATELLQIASALRNSNSGHLLIHLVGQDPEDRFTGMFDEFVDTKLQGLINDGSQFDEVYKKHLLRDNPHPKLNKYSDILVLYVEGSNVLESSNVKSKLALDDCIIDIPHPVLLKLIQTRKTHEEKCHNFTFQNSEDLHKLKESRNIQTKAYLQTCSDEIIASSVVDKLRAAEYISAFSKNKDGGSYLLGIKEVKCKFETYTSKEFQVTPVPIDSCVDVEQDIIQRVSETCLVCDYDGNVKSSDELVMIFFVPSRDIQSAEKDGYIVHIYVKPVSGIVFYEKDGPEAYRVNTQQPDTNSINRLTVSEWFRIFRERCEKLEN